MSDAPPRLFHRGALQHRRARALAGLDAAVATGQPRGDVLLTRAATDIAERLSFIARSFPRVAVLGAQTDAMRAALPAGLGADLTVATERLAGAAARLNGAVVRSDEEALPFGDATLDLIIAPFSLQFVNDLPGAFIQARRALRPDGLFLATLCGGDTLTELRDVLLTAEAEATGGAAPRVAPMADVRALGGLLQRAGFALPVADAETLTLRYGSMLDLMRDLRAMGASGALSAGDGGTAPALGREVFARADALYSARHGDADGRVRATFEVITLSGWAPDASQQKPLAPGSAQVSLTQVLGGGRDTGA